MKNILIASLATFALILFSGEALPKENFPEPPAAYVQKKACPGECCVFRKWSVLKDAALLDRPDGKRVVGIAKKGEWVNGITGEVHILPTHLKVVHPHVSSFDPQITYQVGDILYMLAPMGEGARQTWFKGKMLPRGELLSHIDCSENDQLRCPNPSEECWAAVDGTCNETKMIWWVKVKMKNGAEGWFKELSGSGQSYDNPHFGNRDSCG